MLKKSYFCYFKVWKPRIWLVIYFWKYIWDDGKMENRKEVAFGIRFMLREPKGRFKDYYFCLVNTKSFNVKNKTKIKYSNLSSAMRPFSHWDEIPIPITREANHPYEEEIEE